MQRTFRRSPRLAEYDYQGPLNAFLTLVTRGRRPIFEDAGLAQIALDHLNVTAEKFDAQVFAYCIMPDHVHLLVFIDEHASMKEFVRRFKQTSGFALKKELGVEAWQVSYYDRVLRKEEATEDVALYIWGNPVAAGMVEDIQEYQWNGPRELMP
jgi:REP element-mobilizing transposase RayT